MDPERLRSLEAEWGQLTDRERVLASAAQASVYVIWGFPKIRGTFLGSPHNEEYSILGSILGSPILGNYHIHIQNMWGQSFLQ